MVEDRESEQLPPLCARCAAKLTPGKGDFYLVRIEAFADPSPPDFSEDDLNHDLQAEIERLIGPPGCGKTTVVRRVIERLKDGRVS